MTLAAGLAIPAAAQEEADTLVNEWLSQSYNIGTILPVDRHNSTASVSVIKNDAVNQRSAKNIGNSLIGHGSGLMTIAGNGTYYAQNPTFYVRGLQSLSGTNPLILVDGIERDITMVDPEEVEEVQILKDAAATALYGYKGGDGVINIITKHGEYNSQTIRVNYEHVFSNMVNRPRFVDGATYAMAMNEALANEGRDARYSQQAIDAYKSGQYPELYPNVNWVNETFRNHASGERASVEFSGGGNKFRYFTMANFLYSDGFIKNGSHNTGYSTQDKYVRGNIRTNLDVDLWQYTQLKTNIFTSLAEMQTPGAQADLWTMIYNTPSGAIPVRNEHGVWGGNSTWSGDNNPVAQSMDAAYTKIFDRQLFFDAEVIQDLCMVTKGLKFNIGASYDVISNIVEDHSKKYNYGMSSVTGWNADGTPATSYWQVDDQATEMGTGAAGKSFYRRFNAWAAFSYDNTFAEKHNVMAQLKYHYDYEDPMGTNNNIYRHNISLWGQYTFANRYSLGVALAEMGSSRLAPGTKWNFSPNVSLGAVLLENPEKGVDFLKLRASWGIQNYDRLPNNTWTYYLQNYSFAATAYPWSEKYDGGATGTSITVGQLPMVNPSNEKVAKYDIGFNANFLGCIDLTADYFYNRHYDIFVDGTGAYSSLIGFTAPFKNQGKVDNQGVDIELNFSKNFGDWNVMAGGTFLFAKSKIIDMAEEPKAYENLKQTGNPLSSTYGLIAEGLFTKNDFNADGTLKDGIPAQTFSTVRPGDIRYRDLNNDNVIDANDRTKIGDNPICPEIFYTFNLGAEYKGIGLVAHFQGVGNYGCNLSSQGYYWGLINNSSLSQEVYDNRWNADFNDNADALYPRLSSESNANNYQTSTFWQRDRSYLKLRNVELYYNFSKSLLAKTGFIKGAKVFVRGVDLCNIATGGNNKLENLDPEATGVVAPLTREIAVGVKLTF